MHICYVDESGTPQIPGNTPHYVLAGIAIPIEQWKNCDNQVHWLKNKYSIQGQEMHTGWMLRPYQEQQKIPDFENMNHDQRRSAVMMFRTREIFRLQRKNQKLAAQYKKNCRKTEGYIHLTRKERNEFIIELSGLIGKWDFARLFAECIDKGHFDPNRSQSSIDEQAFEQIVSRLQHFLFNTSTQDCTNMGMIIHDHNDTTAKKLTKLMKLFYRKGTLWTKVNNIIETPLFVDSQLTSMVQIADLCAYALRRYLENQEEVLFNEIFKIADRLRVGNGKVVGVRHFTDKTCTCAICQSRN